MVIATNLEGFKGEWTNSWRTGLSMATSYYGYLLPPVLEAVCLVVLCGRMLLLLSCLWASQGQLAGHFVNKTLDFMALLSDPAWLFLCSCIFKSTKLKRLCPKDLHDRLLLLSLLGAYNLRVRASFLGGGGEVLELSRGK